MVSRTELRGVLKQNQRASKITGERFPSRLSSKHQGDRKEGKRRDADIRIPVRSNASGSSRKDCVNERFKRDDELVKYMSKLPGYLQGEKRGGKVLNIGVLDWGSLEKWKQSRKGGQATECNNASSSGPNTSGRTERSKVSTRTSGILPEDSHWRKIDEQSASCNLSKDNTTGDLQHCVHRVRWTLESESIPRDSINMQQKASFSYKSSGRDHAVADPAKGGKAKLSQDFGLSLFSDMGNSGVSLGVKERVVVGDGENQKALNPDAVVGGQPVRSSKFSVTLDTVDRQSFKNNRTLKISEESQESEAGHVPRKQENKFGSIVVLRPRNALPEEFLMSKDDNSSERRSLIPRSCPLSLDFERDYGSMMVPLGVDLSSDAWTNKLFGRKHSKTASRIFDQEKSEDESTKSRHPSPGKRFSFSFSRLSRSFSFKEESATQPSRIDDSIESDPAKFDSSACPASSMNPEKLNVHTGARASHLKRLLEPLLKPKGTENALPSKARSSSSNLKPTNNSVQLQDMSTTTARALVQLTTRNGFPLFQSVVEDNSNSVLIATMKSWASSSKDDSVRYCTFYSVNEMKKKKSGSWLIRGNKEKQRGFVHKMVGQMRLSNSLSSDLTEQKSGNHCPVRESVLFGSELKQSDQATDKTNASRELGAVVIKRPDENTIILPGGLHSFPNKGAPSPLIDRWRSGGVCDCGGWDVGCKLRVLSDQKRFHEILQLFDQELTPDNSPSFTLSPLKTGIYEVEFDSSMTHLQAFFICVTVITCDCEQRRYEEHELNPESEPRASEDALGTRETDEQRKKKREMPLRCSPFNPPLSPVGRV